MIAFGATLPFAVTGYSVTELPFQFAIPINDGNVRRVLITERKQEEQRHELQQGERPISRLAHEGDLGLDIPPFATRQQLIRR